MREVDTHHHIELSEEGVLSIMMTPVRGWHVEVVMELTAWLLSAGYPPRRLAPDFGVAVGDRGLREPGLMVLRADINRQQRFVDPDDVLVVVGVESPSTRDVDRGDKMREYARAGIGTDWRVEFDGNDEPEVCVYHLRGAAYSQVERIRLDALLKMSPTSVIAPL